MENWIPVEPYVWKPKVAGDFIIGVVVNKAPRDDTTGLSARYQLEDEKGMFLLWGSAILDDRMKYVSVGSKVRITYTGKTSNKRNQQVNLFMVEIAETVPAAPEPSVIEQDPDKMFHSEA